ncbi:MAG: response regulator [Candidatus Solibacter usitatus]|nr:response regulator [Candidatus Solibacter usitatus]
MEALRLCESYGGPIDLLVTDVVMPRMSGPELAARLKALRPAIQVSYVSGYMEELALQQSGEAPPIQYLQKPYTAEGLAGMTREMLDRA